MKLRWALALTAALACAGAAAADRIEGMPGPPAAQKRAVESFRAPIEPAAAASLALAPLATDAKREVERSLGPDQIGISRRADVGAQAAIDERGVKWAPAGSGVAAHIVVASPGALGLRAGVRFEAMPDELEIRVAQRGPDGAPQAVSATSGAALRKAARGVWPVEHWTASTEGEVQWIELWSPRVPVAGELRFRVFDVSHFVLPVSGLPRAKVDFACHVDIACVSDANAQSASRAVAKMLFTHDGRTSVCTGSLLNDRAGSGAPLFATANHCISTQAAASNLETWWFYRSAACGGAVQAATRLGGGAILLVADFDMDFALMRLMQNAPGGTFFLGWDAAPLAPGQAIYGVHHPNGEWQRYSSGTFLMRGRVTESDTHLTFGELFNRVRLTQGIIEGGSSGSPLLTAPTIFHGTLFGSPTDNACGAATNTASYSEFGVIYPMISTFLDGPAAVDDHGDTPASATALAVTAKLVAQINHVADVDWFRFELPSAGDWTVASFDPVSGEGIDTRAEVYAANGATLVASNDDRSATDLNFEMRVHVNAAGTYYLKVSGYESTVGRYGLRSSFLRPDEHGDSAAAATPLAASGNGSGILGVSTDQDWFRVTFTQPGVFHVNSTGTTDTMGALYRADGVTLIAENDDENPPDTNFGLTTIVAGAGSLYLKVTGWNGETGEYGLATSFRPSGATAANYTDLWWNSPAGSENGWGINLNHQDDTLFATLFTYGADGRDLWLVASNVNRQPNGSYAGPLYRVVGAAYNAAWMQPVPTQVGNLTLTFANPTQATLIYSVNGVNVTKTITRQVFDAAPTCAVTAGSRAAATNYQDLWWNPAESGWGINLAHQGNIMFATLFTYGADNRDLWLVASNLARQGDGSFSGALYRTTGPAFNASPWSAINAIEVGNMRVGFASGTTGTLTYTFNGVTVTKPIERQVFGTQPTLCQ